MTKILVGVLVALVLTQSITTQTTLKSVLDGFKTLPLAGLRSIKFNPNNPSWGSIFDDLMAFIESTTSTPPTSLSATITEKLSSCINVALGLLSSQVTSTNEKVFEILVFMASLNLTQRSYLLSSYAITLYTQSVSGISTNVLSLATVLGGERASCKGQVETVDQQAHAFVNLSTDLIGQIQQITQLFNALNQEFGGGNCDCPQTADTQALIDTWSAKNDKISSYYGHSCRKWSLSQYLSKHSSVKIAKAINDTNDFLKNLKVCVGCVLHNIMSNTMTHVCDASNTDALDNIASNFSAVSIDSIFTPKRSLVARIQTIADAFRVEISSKMTLAIKVLKKTTCSKKRHSLNEFIDAIIDVVRRHDLTNEMFMKPVLGNISEWNAAAESTAQPIIWANEDLAATLSADKETCTTCLSNTKITFNQFEFVNAFAKCVKIIEEEINKLASIFIKVFRSFIGEYEEIKLHINACFSEHKINAQCIDSVTDEILQLAQKIYTNFVPIENAMLEGLKTTDEQYEICLLTVSTEISEKIAEQKKQFLNCKAIIALIPDYDAAIVQLKALQVTAVTSIADPICLDPIKAQISELLASSLETNLFELTPEIVSQLINTIKSVTINC